jgi:hypothetical protein
MGGLSSFLLSFVPFILTIRNAGGISDLVNKLCEESGRVEVKALRL